MQTVTLTPLMRRSIGFDRLNDLFESFVNESGQSSPPSYPPYNIEKHGDSSYKLTFAVAGFSEDAIEIITQEDTLTVKGTLLDVEQDQATYLYQGIKNRSFEQKFNLSDYINVVGANLHNGLLTIDLVREVPEASKPKLIPINKNAQVDAKLVTDKPRKKAN